MKKQLVSALLVLTMATSLIACGKKDEVEDTSDSTQAAEEEVEEAVDDSAAFWDQTSEDGKVRSYLTGDWVDAKYGRQRPVAVMIENTKACLPQYGIGNAGIIYECVVEGGITRMMAIFDDYTGLEQIGNIRSSRPYYVYFASEYDAIYMHAGGNPAAFELIDDKDLVDNLNALTLEGSKGKSAAFRTGTSEHTLYTNSDGIDIGIEKLGYDMSLPSDYEPHFQFAADGNTLEQGEDCEALQLYYYTNKPYWIYNEDDGLYYRYEFNQKQVDAITGEQLTAKNIILEDVQWFTYQGSQYLGYMLSNNTGTGKFLTNGKVVDIVWSKDGDTDVTHYYYADTMEEIQLNIGVTWIQACQGGFEGDYTGDNEFYADKSDFSKAN
ncbi:MAG: DUF3048 domain-containing protein [Pseudobutyrivibrio sp.]|nr:DUF3048 domain-containing protein [Pseudobutyrivibrio sp.]